MNIPHEIDRVAAGFGKVLEHMDELAGFTDDRDARLDGQWYGKVNKND